MLSIALHHKERAYAENCDVRAKNRNLTPQESNPLKTALAPTTSPPANHVTAALNYV
jgi:hypothetical protein